MSLRLVASLLLALFALLHDAGTIGAAPAWEGAPRAAAQRDTVIDLAALTLRPADVGQPGFVHVGAFLQPLAAEAADVAAYRGAGLDAEEIAARLAAANWRRQYVA